ncbi:hypothetical protein SUGI_0459590 [Cryptomeria japonica]|uniref:disease resistance protein TAO1 n=1 Tax=Cryptomeria japonica TaxID=3369 RepID=UPI002408BF25|nr:disease resistance protein TAO1 [Cryptomeria japonica]GLJ24101.1 hypothetical protein SUGI_0459590 [Cryptomeria japonica]
MAEYFFSLCCCSCCSSSAPQSLQQEAASSRTPPHRQAVPEHFTPPSPSQPSEKEATDFKNILHKFTDVSKIHGLIQILEDLLKIATGERSDRGSNSAAGSHIQDVKTILEMLDKRIGKRPLRENSTDDAIAEMGKVFIDLLKGSEKISKVGVALSMLGYVLERSSRMHDNKTECLEVLRRMFNLGKQIVELNEQISEQKQKLNEGVQCIVEGTIMCISQLAEADVFRFLAATVNANSLKDFQLKIDRLYSDIHLLASIDIGERVPKISPQTQKIYAYKPTVGMESARETVIQHLDLDAQDETPIVVVVYGFGGIGKTTLADAVYANISLQSYKHCRIQMDQNCTKNDLKILQEQILYGLFRENLKLNNCDDGRARLLSSLKNNPEQLLFLYLDNALKSNDLEQLLPTDFCSCLPPKSRVLVTTRNLKETNIFISSNIRRREYDVSPLPQIESRKLLLKKVPDYSDESNIHKLLELCGGVPLLLELAGSQLAMNTRNTKNIVLEMLREGEKVEDRDISDSMVGFVYDRFSEPVKQAFLDIASYFYNWKSKEVASIVGEEEFGTLEATSFVRTSEGGYVIVHDIVRARGKKLSEQEGNRIRDPETLIECLKSEEKLRNLKGIFLSEGYQQLPIEISLDHLNCMSKSLRVLHNGGSQITFSGKCHKPFEQLRYLKIPSNVPDLPMEFEKLKHLSWYSGPLTQSMSLYEFPPSLCYMNIEDSSTGRVEYSKIPPKVTKDSSLVKLSLYRFKNMTRLPDGVEELTNLEELCLRYCNQLRELPSKLRDLSNLKELTLHHSNKLKNLPADFGQLSNLTRLDLSGCSRLSELPSTFGHLVSLKYLNLKDCKSLTKLPSSFGQLKNLEQLYLRDCSDLKELPPDFGQLKNLIELDLSFSSGLEEWPSSFEDLTKVKKLVLTDCSPNLIQSLPHNIKRSNCIVSK